jgi:peptidoglycan/xylan/chitin deacetylase (PgdA/CDA1 family)
VIEQRFGRSFSGVRVHTDAAASTSADALNASAYTVGRDIVFGHSRYEPRSPRGLGLLAHELAHVAQQESAPMQTSVGHDEPGTVVERQADTMAQAAAHGQPVPAPIPAAQQMMRASRTFSLTFDDGPHAAPLGGGQNLTENVLDTLKARSIRAGFFVQTGVAHRMANAVGRALIARMHAEGHKIGIHTGGVADHELHTKAEAGGRLEGELAAGASAVEKVTGERPQLTTRPSTRRTRRSASPTSCGTSTAIRERTCRAMNSPSASKPESRR